MLDERHCPTCNRPLRTPGPCPKCAWKSATISEEPVIFVSTRDDFQFFGESSGDELPLEDSPSTEDNLATYVLRQIAPDLQKDQYPIAVNIMTSVDEHGLLEGSLFEIARYHHVPIAEVEKVLHVIQRADPLGVASPTSKDAFLVQLEVLAEDQVVPPLAVRAIEEGFDYLTRQKYTELAKVLGTTTRSARRIARFIGENLNPFPAQAHWGDIRKSNRPNPHAYQRPDVLIKYMNGDPEAPLMVEILLPIAGTLRVSPMFKEAVHTAAKEKLEKFKADLENANLLVKCLKQRNHTMVRLMKRLVKRQRTFIIEGDHYLTPMTRALIAAELEVHESTISRAVSNKTAQLPSGKIIPLSKFFDRSLHIRSVLKDIISEEGKPLSDTQISKILAEKGFKVARRTVAKYRTMEGIFPAHLRHKSLTTPA